MVEEAHLVSPGGREDVLVSSVGRVDLGDEDALLRLPGLDEPLRSRVSDDMLAARQRCMACVERQLVACGDDRPQLRACLDRQRRLMSAELEVLGAEIGRRAAPARA